MSRDLRSENDRPADPDWLLQGRRFNVKKVSYPRASGGAVDREVVVPADAVVILPLLRTDEGEEKIVLIRNHRFAVDRSLWEIPAGTLEPGEDPQACAARELTEETGYEAASLRRLTTFFTSPGFCTERMTAFTATGLRYRGQDLDETERIEVELRSRDDTLAMIRSNEIEDAKTIATLLFHQTFEKQG